MNLRIACALGALLVVPVLASVPAQPPNSGDLIVHEWGTFLNMNGSDGVTLDGMYHEEHALPAFVHSRSKDQLHLPGTLMKGETPVIYFYTERKQQVNVKVGFPEGVWTQWYPQAAMVGPKFSQASSYLPPKNGRIAWSAEVVPAKDAGSPPLAAAPKDALWRFARQVDSAYVRVGEGAGGAKENSEWERFIFYRGLGRASLPLEASMQAGGTLGLSAGNPFTLHRLLVVRVENGRGAMKEIEALHPGDRLAGILPSMESSEPVAAFANRAEGSLAAHLVDAGLFPKEARAMTKTWRSSYFESDGIRVLYVLPQSWTDSFIPMSLEPKPGRLVRVMVGRTELLTPERERRAQAAVQSLFSPDSAEREKGFNYLLEQGRYVEPVIRRTLHSTKWMSVERLCKRLLLSEFVTELRSAANAPYSGKYYADRPVRVRAQLASLLREVGLNDQARAEGERVLADLRKESCPPLTSDEARHYLRAEARAMEGIGDDRAAAAGYEKLVRFGSQVSGGCGGCHDGSVAPRSMAWFRDWYAGRKYARYATLSRTAEEAIKTQEAALTRNPNDPAARLLLAYLYELKGGTAQAEAQWSSLGHANRLTAR